MFNILMAQKTQVEPSALFSYVSCYCDLQIPSTYHIIFLFKVSFLRIFLLLASGVPSCTHLPCIDTRYKRSQVDGRKCKSGERWMEACNECFCTETGIGACTLRGCLGQNASSNFRASVVSPSAIKRVTMDEYNQDDFECIPQEYFKLDCNNCKCSSDGRTGKCTKKACINLNNP